MLKVISGFQTGADIAGVTVAKLFGFLTGGMIPKGYRTLAGPKPEYKETFGAVEHTSESYVPRTRANVKNSDGTLRLAFNFKSPGERCTLTAINNFKKIHFDVNFWHPVPPQAAYEWIKNNNIQTLNVAGNAEETFPGMFTVASEYLTQLFTLILKDKEMNAQLKESLAEVQHDIWSAWLQNMLSNAKINGAPDDEFVILTIPREKLNKWKEQIDKKYSELSEDEKDLDRLQAEKVIQALWGTKIEVKS